MSSNASSFEQQTSLTDVLSTESFATRLIACRLTNFDSNTDLFAQESPNLHQQPIFSINDADIIKWIVLCMKRMTIRQSIKMLYANKSNKTLAVLLNDGLLKNLRRKRLWRKQAITFEKMTFDTIILQKYNLKINITVETLVEMLIIRNIIIITTNILLLCRISSYIIMNVKVSKYCMTRQLTLKETNNRKLSSYEMDKFLAKWTFFGKVDVFLVVWTFFWQSGQYFAAKWTIGFLVQWIFVCG